MTRVKSLVRFGFWMALLAAAILLALNFQSVVDWYRLRGYSAPTTVVELANEDTMTPLARHIFYVNHPQIVGDVSQFHQACPQSEQTIVLGCYHSDQRGIAVYDIADARLNGVEEVTAAHEMLHAAYDRLSSKEKKTIDSELIRFYQNDLHDERIIKTIKAYTQSEPNDVVNEMHSVFGTEVDNLPSDLQTYYQRYFTSRSAVVNFSNGYEAEFTNREAKLDNLKQQIDQEKQNLDSQLTTLENQRQQMEILRSQGRIDEYNAQVPIFNSRVRAYNAAVNQLNDDIRTYNSLVAELRSLNQALDTRATIQTAQ